MPGGGGGGGVYGQSGHMGVPEKEITRRSMERANDVRGAAVASSAGSESWVLPCSFCMRFRLSSFRREYRLRYDFVLENKRSHSTEHRLNSMFRDQENGNVLIDFTSI